MAPLADGPRPPNSGQTPDEAAKFYSTHPRALIAKRMINGILQLVQTKKGTTYAPIRPGSNHLIAGEKRISARVLASLASDIKRAFWVAYRFDDDTLDMAAWAWSDADLATLWGAYCDGVFVWPAALLKRARSEVGEDWERFCKIEGLKPITIY